MTTAETGGERLLPRPAAVVPFAVVAALLAAAAPLATYAASLAFFGLPHVLVEMRYVDGRFGRRTPRGLVVAIALLLAAVVALRVLVIGGALTATTAISLELGVVAVAAFAVLPALARAPLGATVALLLGVGLALGSWRAPVTVAVVLAVLHNLTPVGFLWERLGTRRVRGRVAVVLAVLFGGVPLLIASGVPARALAGLGGMALGEPLVGPLAAHLGVFVPRGWFQLDTAEHVFAAAAYLQVLHHATVLLVLPRLLRSGEDAIDRPLLRWPRGRPVVAGLAAVAVVTALGFVLDFRGTRAAYGVLAAVHAWIEVPVLLLALGAFGRRATGPLAAAAA